MAYTVKHYMAKTPNTIDVDSTVTAAAKVMASDADHAGYVLVLEHGRPVGMVTERDIVNRVVADERDPAQPLLSEIMSSPLRAVDPDDTLLQAATQIQTHDVRKLVVMRGDIVYGVITANEIAQRCGEYVDNTAKDIIRWSALLDV